MTTIISWNVNGLRAVDRKGQFKRILEEKPDILCLQETKSLPEQLSDELRRPDDYCSYFHFPTIKKGYSGVAIYSKIKPLEVKNDLGIEDMDQEGRLIMAKYKDFTLLNIYFPNGGGAPERLEYKLKFYEHFLEFVDKLRETEPNIIFCGDVNVAHREIDIARPKENINHVGFLPIERAWVDKLIEHGWTDVYRHFNPDKKDMYTYWDMKTYARERNVGWRIDYFFCSENILKNIKSVHILDTILGSDHCPIQITFN
ncbi:MAG: exodeoxyribonuclease III [Parcubacteria bacterium C7867-005]|nr:MAG: exodeoxyribonuclease III [Parcubacteria bacterium C7867-005]